MASGGLPRSIHRRLLQLAESFARDPTYRPRGAQPPLKPGTWLLRVWKGETREVTATSDEFVYRGHPCSSLSAVARAITSTRWSGPAFFGLERAGRNEA